MLEWIGQLYLRQPIVNLAEHPAGVAVSWHNYPSGRVWRVDDDREREERRREFLELLGQPTGLRFTVKEHEVELWRIATAPAADAHEETD